MSGAEAMNQVRTDENPKVKTDTHIVTYATGITAAIDHPSMFPEPTTPVKPRSN